MNRIGAVVATWAALAVGPALAQEADLDRPLSPADIMFRDLRDLASSGLLPEVPAHELAGGRIFTRGEIARLLGQAAGRLDQLSEAERPLARTRIERVGRYLEPELRALGIDLRPDRPPVDEPPAEPAGEEEEEGWPLGLEFHGSITSRLGLVEGRNNDEFSVLLDSEVSGDFFRLGLSGIFQEERPADFEREPGDIFIDSRYTFDLTDRFVELFGRFASDDLEVNGRAGTERNLQFAEGLVLGAFDLDGYRLRTTYRDDHRLVLLAGQASDRSEVAGVRIEGVPVAEVDVDGVRWIESIRLGATAVDVNREKAGWVQIGGLDARIATPWVELTVENAYLDGGSGWGLYAAARTTFSRQWIFEAGHRHYEAFAFDFNNGPIYSGIGGGDDEDEIGSFGRVVLRPWEFLEAELAYDRSRRPGDGRGFENVRTGLTLTPRSGTRFGGEFEYEIDHLGSGVTRVVTARASHLFFGRYGATAEYRRDDDSVDNIETWRGSLDIPVLEDRLGVVLTDTFRRSNAGRENVFEIRINLRIVESLHATINLTHNDQDDEMNRADITLLLRW